MIRNPQFGALISKITGCPRTVLCDEIMHAQNCLILEPKNLPKIHTTHINIHAYRTLQSGSGNIGVKFLITYEISVFDRLASGAILVYRLTTSRERSLCNTCLLWGRV